MQAKDLLVVLEKLRDGLEKLNQNAKDKQIALVKLNNQLLLETVSGEEKLTLLVKKTEQERINTIVALNRGKGLPEGEYRLAAFVKNFKDELDEKSIKLIRAYEKTIKALTLETMKYNKQNLFLINHSRKFITMVMNILYQDKSRSLFDKKV